MAENVWQVTTVDNFNNFYSPLTKHANIAPFHDNSRFALAEVDICAAESSRKVFEKTELDAIVHLAARAGVRPSLLQPELYVETNVQ